MGVRTAALLLELAGIGLMVWAVVLMWLPLGLLAAGFVVLTVGVIVERGGDARKPDTPPKS